MTILQHWIPAFADVSYYAVFKSVMPAKAGIQIFPLTLLTRESKVLSSCRTWSGIQKV